MNIYMAEKLIVRYLGRQAYEKSLTCMHEFTDSRDAATCDEIWVLEHDPVYTQGQAGKAEHLLTKTTIPVIHSDRGGQITYHGPGQLIIYLLLDLKRLQLGVRNFVKLIEENIIELLAQYEITATVKQGAPGVYVEGSKIASLGIRIRKGFSMHGVALNVDMDLAPFLGINPCGYAGLPMTQMKTYTSSLDMMQISNQIVKQFQSTLNYSAIKWIVDEVYKPIT